MSKKLFKSFGYKAIHIVVLMLYSILLIPVLLNFWDLEVYGTWIALYAFFNLIKVIEFGHSVYVGNEFNRIVHFDEMQSKILLGSALRANLIVGLLQITLVICFYYIGLFSYFLDHDIDDTAVVIVLCILFLYRMFIGSFRGIIVKILNPFGLIYKSFQFSLLEKILEFLVLIVAAIIGFSLIQLALLWFFAKFIYSIVILIKLKKIVPDYFPWWKYGSFKIGINNFIKSFTYGASNFLDRLGNDGIILVASAMVGSSFLPLFSATKTLVNFGLKLSDFFLNPLAPEMINYFANNKKNKIIDIFKAYWFGTSLILMFGFAVSLFFIEDIFVFWTNGKLEFNMILYCALAIILLIKVYGKALIAFFTGINKLKTVLLTSVFRVSLFFIIIFVFRSYGLNGVLLGLFFSELLVVLFWLPFHIFKIFSFTIFQKIIFFIYLAAVFFLGLLFYAYSMNFDLWILILLFILIMAIVYYQYKLISEKTRNNILNKLKKLTTFANKRNK